MQNLLALISGVVVTLASARAGEPSFEVTVVLDNLESPWDVAIMPDGHVLYTEKCRGLSISKKASDAFENPLRLFGATGSVLEAPDFFCVGQSGMHGVAIDPEFGHSNRYIYVFFPSTMNQDTTGRRWNHVARLTLSADLVSVSQRVDILQDIFFKEKANGVGGTGGHSGGRIKFGPDGFLYVTTGDNHNATLPQDIMALGGKILRVDRSGAAAPDNNIPSGADPRIYMYGLRNSQGIAFRPGTGQVYVSEHGPGYDDEVTLLVAGGNGGWDPQNRPSLNCPSNYCGYAGIPTTMPMTDTQRFPAALPPLYVYNNNERGMCPNEFLIGSQWGAWNGNMLVGILAGKELIRLQLNEAGNCVENEQKLKDDVFPAVRYRGLTLGPQGDLFLVADHGVIWMVSPVTAAAMTNIRNVSAPITATTTSTIVSTTITAASSPTWTSRASYVSNGFSLRASLLFLSILCFV